MTLSPGARLRLEFAAKAFLLCAFAGSVTAGLFRIHERAVASEQNQVDLGQWSIVSKPEWCTDDDVRGIRDGAALRGWQTPLLDPASGPVVASALESSPHVKRVLSLRKVYPNAYDAVLEVRRPVAALQLAARPERWVEVDEEGVVLSAPHTTRPMRDGKALRVIVGAVARDTRPGARLGRDVIDAAVLCADLEECSSSPQDVARLDVVDVVDVTNHGGRKKNGESEILLRSSGVRAPVASPTPPSAQSGRSAATPAAAAAPRCVVEWGRAQGVAESLCDDLEPTFGAKAERLLQVLRSYPDLRGLDVVRVGFSDVTVVPSPVKNAKR